MTHKQQLVSQPKIVVHTVYIVTPFKLSLELHSHFPACLSINTWRHAGILHAESNKNHTQIFTASSTLFTNTCKWNSIINPKCKPIDKIVFLIKIILYKNLTLQSDMFTCEPLPEAIKV